MDIRSYVELYIIRTISSEKLYLVSDQEGPFDLWKVRKKN